MKVSVDKELCTGTGLCVSTCPEIFELDDEGLSTAKTQTVPPELEESCSEAADNCPTDAIIIEE